MIDQSKVLLIGCLAASAGLLDNFLPSMAGESTVYSEAVAAPQPVRFSRQREPMILVRPVPGTPEQLAVVGTDQTLSRKNTPSIDTPNK